MYVFGGCTQSSCNAAFNDLWRLDLNSKEWIRPLASGERENAALCPSPGNSLRTETHDPFGVGLKNRLLGPQVLCQICL